MRHYRVKLAPSLLESMTLATIEAFGFRGPRANKKSGVETYGYVWGTKKLCPDGVMVFYLDKLSVSLTAKKSSGTVWPNAEAGELKSQLLKRMAPHQTLLAEFHSHPYANSLAMNRQAGFEFSKEDFTTFLDDDLFWENADNTPVMLVQTVCPIRQQTGKSAGWYRRNVFFFDIDGHRFWVNAAVGYLDEKGKRRCTGNRSRLVTIEPTPFAGDLFLPESDK
jgi:hypothetical protein